ncbi:MMPL family transporter [Nocardioides sp. B-3]|nr:MMPL family transporter [Nocardioides sp. B-3]UUZ61716.1 MMPL family transporter [Nocardioides sp. B-3]
MVKDGVAFIEAAIDSDPSSPAAFEAVESVRDAVHAVDGADALVGGGSAFYLDTKEAANADNVLIIPIILLVVFLILMALLRSVLAPLILIGTVVLSFGAAVGISSVLFKYVFGFAGSDPGFPLFAFVFPGGPGHRLQHLLDDASPRGDDAPRHPARDHWSP